MTVVVDGQHCHVDAVDHDAVQLVALSAGIAHRWDGIGCRWTFDASDALAVASALRGTGRSVRLATGTGRTA